MGGKILQLLEGVGAYTIMVWEVLLVSLRRPPAFALVRNQMYQLGVGSLPVIAITGLSSGAVLSAQSMFQLSNFGVTGATGLMVAKSMLVEMGPLIAAFMVTGRVGAAICAELGTMAVTEQIDALRAMSVNPIRYLVAPRFIAGMTMMPLLTLFNVVMGILGGYWIAVYYYHQPHAEFIDPVRDNIENYDLLMCFVKSFIFGTIITTICCYRGMTTTGGAAGVGQRTTNSVVICVSLILVLNVIITVAMNHSYDFLRNMFPKFL